MTLIIYSFIPYFLHFIFLHDYFVWNILVAVHKSKKDEGKSKKYSVLYTDISSIISTYQFQRHKSMSTLLNIAQCNALKYFDNEHF